MDSGADLVDDTVPVRPGDGRSGKDAFPTKPALSYASMLRNHAVESMAEDEIDLTEEDCSVVQGKHGPGVVFSERAMEVLAKPWRNSVVVHLMGKPSSVNTYKFILNGLRRKWRSSGRWKLIDLLNDFFIVKFDLEEDLEAALCGGPWVLAGQTLVVRRWSQHFNPVADEVTSMAVWARVIGLPVMFFNDFSLQKVGGLLGEVVKIDPLTYQHDRGRYARICVEVDLKSPFKSEVYVNGTYYKVKYEGLDLLCFNCGVFGHSREQCSVVDPRNVSCTPHMESSDGSAVHEGGSEDNSKGRVEKVMMEKPGEEGEDGFGPWMLVNFRGKKKNSKASAEKHSVAEGSRFNVLQESVQDHPQEPAVVDHMGAKKGSVIHGGTQKASLYNAEKWRRVQRDLVEEAVLGEGEVMELGKGAFLSKDFTPVDLREGSLPSSPPRVPLVDLSNANMSKRSSVARGIRKFGGGGILNSDGNPKKPILMAAVRNPFPKNSDLSSVKFPGYFGRRPPEEEGGKDPDGTIDIQMETGRYFAGVVNDVQVEDEATMVTRSDEDLPLGY